MLDPAVVGRRRVLVGTLVLVLLLPAVFLMADWHYRTGFDALKAVHLALFTVLFGLIAFGAVQAVVGFWVRRGGDRWQITAGESATAPLPDEAATAVVIPVYNEDPGRVLEGLRVIYESIERTGQIGVFEFFILSDSTDPNRWIEEEAAWVALTRQLGARGRIFYRRRRSNTNRKAGNIADFCRRWGRRYRYMVVLDADSIMSGETIVELVRRMEGNPGTGIIQTVPRLALGETAFARLQQFASRLYGPLFVPGLAYWQMDEGNYWGHNAILRTAPFIEHCSLPELPGAEPFGGRILSHDYVEAALMRRAGWAVWLATDLAGSYEESPPNVIDHAKRDRRWLQGNLQHAWLLAARGLRAVNRVHLVLGIMAYASSPLWLAFMVLSLGLVARETRETPDAASLLAAADGGGALGGGTAQGVGLFAATLALLFLPKVLALVDLGLHRDELARWGGWGRLLPGVAVETLAFTLLAPVFMLFHTKFLFLTLAGRGVQWVTQRRGQDGAIEWREAILTHAEHTLFGFALAAAAWWASPAAFFWMLPVASGLWLAIPVSLILGQVDAGQRLRRLGVLAVPEERQPPDELRILSERLALRRRHVVPLPALTADHGLLQAVLDPYVNAVHLSLLRDRERVEPAATLEKFAELRERLLREGPGVLSRAEKLSVLQHADSLALLHQELWSRPEADLSPWWRLAIRQYNVVSPVPPTALYR
jgi:membrane glycosyltransferase